MSEGRVMVVEDDPAMQRLLRTHLGARGYDVHTIDNGTDAVTAMADLEPDLVLLDIGLPGIDGLEVCRKIREWSEGPIILVSAQNAPTTKATALELGADDYISKPFHMVELVARIRAVMRRARGSATAMPTSFQIDDLTVDVVRRQVNRNGSRIDLTKTEFDLLRAFLNNADRALTYQQLLEAVWGTGYDDPHLVHVHVCNLRRKLWKAPGSPHRIVAFPGVGYMLSTSGDPGCADAPVW